MLRDFLPLGLVALSQASHSHGNLHHYRHHALARSMEGGGGLLGASPQAVNSSPVVDTAVEKRSSVRCTLPDDPDLVFVPGEKNGGFAMSPDQPCEADMYCPIACVPGKVMAQWDPDSSYTPATSMNGGLYCGKDGKAVKPFKDTPYCVDGTSAVKVDNKCGGKVSFCQTVLPGNEAMLIPTVVKPGSSETIAVPDHTYWGSTSAHYYVNPPGTGNEGCIWGDTSQPVGNWAAYVAGANTVKNGNTFVNLGWNPIFLTEGNGLEKTLPAYGVRINCPGCNGAPASIDPRKGLGKVDCATPATGAGGAKFCVVTVPPGKKATIEVFSVGDDSYGEYDDKKDEKKDDKDEKKDEKKDDKDEENKPEEKAQVEEKEEETSSEATSTVSSSEPSSTPASETTSSPADSEGTTTEESPSETTVKTSTSDKTSKSLMRGDIFQESITVTDKQSAPPSQPTSTPESMDEEANDEETDDESAALRLSMSGLIAVAMALLVL